MDTITRTLENCAVEPGLCESPFCDVLSSSSYQSTSKNDKILEYAICLNGIRVSNLIDTGATASFIDSKLLDDENFKHYKNFIETFSVPRAIVVANGSQVPIEGLITVPLLIDDDTYEVELNIVSKLPFNIVLGMDFCKKYAANIDTSKGTLTLKRSFECEETPRIVLASNITIPPLCEKIVPIRYINNRKGTYFVSASPYLLSRYGISVAKGIMDTRNSKITVANFTNQVYASEAKMLEEHVLKFVDLFEDSPDFQQTTHLVEHTISTGEAKPIDLAPYRSGHKKRLKFKPKLKRC